MRITESFAAATPKDFAIGGDFFRIETGAAAIDVDFYRLGQVLPENLRAATAGYWAAPAGGFDRLVITSSALQSVAVDVYRGRVGADRVAGSVSISSPPTGVHAPAAVGVTNASAVILAANGGRKYLLIQNQHASLSLWVRCDGAAATATPACIELPPGAVWEPSVVPVGEIRGIRSSAAAGDNVHVIEA